MSVYDLLTIDIVLVDPDDFLNKTEKLEGGYFVLTGTENEFFSISPYLKIKHRCDVDNSRVSQLSGLSKIGVNE